MNNMIPLNDIEINTPKKTEKLVERNNFIPFNAFEQTNDLVH